MWLWNIEYQCIKWMILCCAIVSSSSVGPEYIPYPNLAIALFAITLLTMIVWALISAWISDHQPDKVWDYITHSQNSTIPTLKFGNG